MFISKKLSIVAAIAVILGFMFMSLPAEAGFFDWFKSTPLNQEAQAIKATAEIRKAEAEKLKVQEEVKKIEQKYDVKVEVKEEAKPTTNTRTQTKTVAPTKVETKTVTPTKTTEVKRVITPTTVEKDEGSAVSRFFRTLFTSEEKESDAKKVEISNQAEEKSHDGSTDVSEYMDYSAQDKEVSVGDNYVEKVKDTLRYGDYGPQVVSMQKALQYNGYYNGRISGSYDAATADALKNFQQNEPPKQVWVTGKVAGNKTLAKINEVIEEMNGGGVSYSATCPTQNQTSAILNLLASFGSAQSVIDDVEYIMNGGQMESYYPGANLSENMVDSIVALLESFGCDGELIDDVETVLEGTGANILGQISFWYGKVNVHRELGQSVWATDPDGVAGAGTYAQFGSEGWIDRKLEYCQRFWPNTVSVSEAGTMQITGWYGRNNIGGPLTSNKMAYNCVGNPTTNSQIPMSWQWVTLSNTTLTNSTNHLVGKLRITNNSSDDITFESDDQNLIVLRANSDADNTDGSSENIRFKDQFGNLLDSVQFVGQMNSDQIVLDFSSADLTISPNASETIFIYIDSSDHEDNNDFFQLCVSQDPWAVQYGVDGTGSISTDSLDIVNSMPNNCAQVHVNPGGNSGGQGSLTVTLDSSSPMEDIILDDEQDGEEVIAIFRVSSTYNEPIDIESFEIDDIGSGTAVDTYHFQAKTQTGSNIGPQKHVANNGPLVAMWSSGDVTVPANGHIKMEVEISTADLDSVPAGNGEYIQIRVDEGEVEGSGVNTNDDYESVGVAESERFHIFQAYPEFEWMTLSNTVLTNNANHLAGKLRIRAIGDEDITFEVFADNRIAAQASMVRADDDFGVPDPRFTVKDDNGQTIDMNLWVSNGTTEVMNNFSESGLLIPSGQYRDLFYYFNSSDLETDNDSIQLWLDDGAPYDLSWSIDSDGNSYDEFADILWRADHMSDNYAQLHINPS
jgi:hypothetical protein